MSNDEWNPAIIRYPGGVGVASVLSTSWSRRPRLLHLPSITVSPPPHRICIRGRPLAAEIWRQMHGLVGEQGRLARSAGGDEPLAVSESIRRTYVWENNDIFEFVHLFYTSNMFPRKHTHTNKQLQPQLSVTTTTTTTTTTATKNSNKNNYMHITSRPLMP